MRQAAALVLLRLLPLLAPLLLLPCQAHDGVAQKQFTLEFDQDGVVWLLGSPLAFLGVDQTDQDFLTDTVFPNADTYSTVEMIGTTADTERVRIPSGIGKMCKLSVVVVHGVQGTIPTEVGTLERLVALQLEGNITSIPSQLGRASSLQALSLHRTSGTHALPLPSEILRLSNLKAAVFRGVRFEASVSPAIARLTDLQQLFLSDGGLDGPLPSELGLLGQLEVLDTRESPGLSSRLPSELGQLAPKLRILWAHSCAIEGRLPSQLGLLSSLEGLDVHDNSLSGTLASELGSLRRLRALHAGQNSLSGPVPSELGLLETCTSLSLGANLLSGTVPTQLWLLDKLESLALHSNDLQGTLPSQVGLLVRARRLAVGNNPSLGGTLPSQLGLLDQLVGLGLEGCGFHGVIPTQLGALSGLETLTVAHNRLGSSLPVHLAALTSLISLDVGWNQLTGTIPAELVAALSHLTSVVLEHNSFDGVLAIPDDGAAEDAIRGVWLVNCTDSGLSRSQCELSCAPCRGWEWKVRDCRGQGQQPLCMPVFAPPLVVLGAVAGVVWVVTRCGAGPKPNKEWAMLVALCAYHLVDLLTDALFAIGAHGLTGTLAFCTLGVEFGGALLGALWTLHRSHFDQGTPARVAVVIASVLYPSTLKHITTPEQFHKPVVFLLLSLSLWEALFQGLLQAYSALAGSATAVVLLALALSTVTILSKVSVFVILSLSRGEPSEGSEPQTDGAEMQLATHGAQPTKTSVAHGSGDVGQGSALWAQGSDKEEGEGEGKDEGVDKCPDAESHNNNDNEDRTESAQSRVKRWKRRVLVTLCCGATLASILSTTSPTHQMANKGAAGRFHRQGLLATRTQPPQGAVPRVHWDVGLPAMQLGSPVAKAECPNSLATFNQDIVEVFGIPVGLTSPASATTDFGAALSSYSDTLAFIYLRPTLSRVPTEIGLATACQTMYLALFDGPVPSQIGLMQNLQQLFLYDWDAGTLPSQFGLLTKLTHFETEHCIAGPLPSQIGLVPLSSFVAVAMPLYGLPSQLVAVASLVSLAFPGASAFGDVLDFVHRNFESIDFSGNAFSGTIPTTLGLCSNLTALDLATNSFVGTIPSELGLVTNLTTLDLSSNQLHGTVPTQLGTLAGLVRLGLDNNQALGGSVPSELGQCTRLAALALGANAFTGTLPSQLGRLSALTELGLESNGMSGALPSQLGRLSLLASLDVANNNLGGSLPPQFARLAALTFVALGNNQLSGKWPVQGAALALWTQHCEFSGLESGSRCARECPSCGPLAIAVRDCDARGFNGTCAPWFVLVPALALVFAAMWFWVLRSSGNRAALSARRRAVVAVGSTFAVLVWIVMLTFVAAITGAIRALAIAVLGLRVLLTSLVATAELAYNHRTAPSTTLLSYTDLIAAFVHCVVDPFVVLGLSRARVRPRTVVAVVTTVLASDLPMLVLESVEVHRRKQENRPTAVATLALTLTTLLLVSCARGCVLCRNEHK